MRKAADAAQGENSNEIIANAPSKYKCGAGLIPMIVASTAPAPKINAGMYNGKIRIEIKTPPPRNPSVNAAPTASAETGRHGSYASPEGPLER